ncbi:ribonuclease H-like domain-containing protein [Tanacetum coccineum]
MWLFRHKYLADGMLSCYKARLVANGSTQLEGVDVDETFSLVVKTGTIRIVLSLATSRHWLIHQLDVNNAFLHGDLSKTVYMHQPPRFRDSMHPDYHKYVVEILKRAHMASCNPSRTPVDTKSSSEMMVCLYMHNPWEPHFSALKRILRYARDWAGCPTTQRSTSGYCVFLNNNLLSWSSKHQPTLSRSIAEAKYRGVANVVAETFQHQRTKQIEIDIHFVRDLVVAGQVRVLHVHSHYQYVDIFTKGFPFALFEEFRTSLSVRCPPAPTAGEC